MTDVQKLELQKRNSCMFGGGGKCESIRDMCVRVGPIKVGSGNVYMCEGGFGLMGCVSVKVLSYCVGIASRCRTAPYCIEIAMFCPWGSPMSPKVHYSTAVA